MKPSTFVPITPLLVVGLLGSLASASAATRTWDGGSPFGGNWSDAINWDGNFLSPVAGDILVFPAGAARTLNTNNYPANTRFHTIYINGDNYNIYGNAVIVTNFISAGTGASANVFRPNLQLVRDFSILALGTGLQVTVAGNINLNGNTLSLRSEGELRCSGVISNTGEVETLGNGRVVFTGISANTYSGPTTVLNGTLELAKYIVLNPGAIRVPRIAVPDDLIVGPGGSSLISDAVVFQANNQIAEAAEVTVTSTAELNLNGYSQRIRVLRVSGGHVRSGSGTLSVFSEVACEPDADGSVISGNLNLESRPVLRTLGSARLNVSAVVTASPGAVLLVTSSGPGDVNLSGANTYTGGTVVSNGTLRVIGNSALGPGTNGVTIHGRLVLANATIHGRTLTARRAFSAAVLAAEGSSAWNGDVVLEATMLEDGVFVDTAAGSTLVLSGQISGAGALVKREPGLLRLGGTNSNTFTGDTDVDEGTLELAKQNAVAIVGRLSVGYPLGGVGVLRYAGPDQLADTASIGLWNDGLVRLGPWTDRIAVLSGSGEVDLGTGTLAVGRDTGFMLYSGVLSGSGSLVKTGFNTLTLAGTSTHTGNTVVGQGALFVNGRLNPSGLVRVGNGCILGGTGVVGNVVASFGSSVWPGVSPGELTATSLSLSNGAVLNLELNGTTPVTGYDRVRVSETVTLGGLLGVTTGFLPALGDSFLIVNKTGAGAIDGTFAGLPEGATVVASNALFRITYTGGDGNDAVLTRIATPASVLTAIHTLPDGSRQVLGLGVPGLVYAIEAATNLNSPISWTALGTDQASRPGFPLPGVYEFLDTNAPLFPRRFYRAVSP